MITLTTDFSSKEHYAGVLKGVIKSYGPIEVVDISHDVEPFDILHGAYILMNIIGYFPDDTVHVVVIDPGVGTPRRGILARLDQGYFVGPDNGILTLVKRRIKEVYEIISPGNISRTFHGRDVFVPVAAKISMKKWPENLKRINADEIVTLPIKDPIIEKNAIISQIIHIDMFGNVITNVPEEFVKFSYDEEIFINYHGMHRAKFKGTYAEALENELITLINSENLLEIAMNKSSAAKFLNAKKMDEVIFELP